VATFTLGLALGLAHCASDLGDLTGGEPAASDNPLDQTPGWSRLYPSPPANTGGSAGQPNQNTQGSGSGKGGLMPDEQSYPGGACSSRQGTFCIDFDLGEAFSPFNEIEGAPAPLADSDEKLSEPRSMLVTAEATTREGPFSSKGTRNFATRANAFLLDFQFSPEQVSQTRAIVAAVDFLGKPTALYSLQLVYAGGELGLEESFPESAVANKRFASVKLPNGAGRWSHLRLEASLEGSPTATLKLVNDWSDTASLVGASSFVLSPPSGMSRSPSLALGIAQGEQPHQGWKLRYDNVVFDVR
jgi:hypothetical protein